MGVDFKKAALGPGGVVGELQDLVRCHSDARWHRLEIGLATAADAEAFHPAYTRHALDRRLQRRAV
jgi:hypothetical protein